MNGTTDSTPVLIIDDDNTCAISIGALAEEYDVHCCNNLDDAVKNCCEKQPTIVLLNIDKCGEETKEIIDLIRANCDQHPSVLCLSDSGDLNTRLSAYKFGGDDYLKRPLAADELSAKLNKLKEFHQQQRSLASNNKMATEAVMSAMTEASQYGNVLQFFNKMYLSKNVDQIKDSFFALMEDFGLKTSIQFRTSETTTYDSTGKDVRPIELQVYENLCGGDRLVPFNARLLVNGTYVSFIVKNMPVDDEIATGRFQDILAVLIEGLDAKAIDLQRIALLRQTAREVESSSKRLHTVMEHHEGVVVNAMNLVISEISGSFDVLELNERQEEFFTTLMENVINGIEESLIDIGNEQNVLNCLWVTLDNVIGRSIHVDSE